MGYDQNFVYTENKRTVEITSNWKCEFLLRNFNTGEKKPGG